MDIPNAIIDLFKADVFARTDDGDIDPIAVPTNATIGAHIAGNPWKGILKIRENGTIGKDNKVIEGKIHEISSQPKNGGLTGAPAGNTELRKVAKTYDIYKLLNDAPHGSADGK